MLLTFMIISLTASVIFCFLNHPMTMGLTLLIQTIIISLTMGFFNYNFWYAYILFLIMIGGMLVLFIYMTSVASNEKFEYSYKLNLFILFLIFMMLPLYIINDFYFNINNYYYESINNMSTFTLSLNKFLNYPNNMIIYLIILYLLITLIAVVKITNIKHGPLRHSN
uniref:NADH-ubiquinone oxidoreductase chain 6 n=1 Tax=Glaphyrus comosus TaxID=1227469 RepID=S4SVE2_9SCAR|nr:NADH dehydrogenase subunit 6 [Glaphyrus comosus]